MCAVCHGRTGDGYAADSAPALSHPDFLASVTDKFLSTAITNGRGGTTMSAWGQSHGGPLKPDEVNAVVAFLRTWDVRPRPTLDDRPSEGDVARGEAAFGRECVRCHGLKGTAGPYEHIGNAELLSLAGNGFLRQAIHDGRAGTPMPAFGVSLGDGAIDDVIALLRSWQAKPSLAAQTPARPPPLPLGPLPLNPRGPEPDGFVTYPGYTKVDAVKAQLDRHARLAILDARAPSDYMGEHITGAVSVPFYDPDPYIDKLPRDAWLVCYCSCPHAESGQLARKLTGKGFTKVTILDEGLGVWRMRNYGTHGGVDP